VPVLFVPGHLGSYQQMRSMAAETSREVVGRLTQSRNANAWDMWLDWHAVDFSSEPSALDARLLSRQSAFVTQCVHYLWRTKASNKGQRMILVGYSMGGLVVEESMRRLVARDDPEFGFGKRHACV
jgi:GPI inositol-deacylase